MADEWRMALEELLRKADRPETGDFSTCALLAEFNAYLDREHADPTADSVSYRQFPLWLNELELAELIADLRTATVSKLDNAPAPGRNPYVLSTIFFPTEAVPPHAADTQDELVSATRQAPISTLDHTRGSTTRSEAPIPRPSWTASIFASQPAPTEPQNHKPCRSCRH
jgi:hypothetical protein